MSWKLAKILEETRRTLDNKYPSRSKTSDGTIGDTAHAARKSGHNPAKSRWSRTPIVRAIDITHDPVNDVDCASLAEHLRVSKSDSLAFVIYNHRIFAGNGGISPWTWRRYYGSNPHTKHIHIEVKHTIGDINGVSLFGRNTVKVYTKRQADTARAYVQTHRFTAIVSEASSDGMAKRWAILLLKRARYLSNDASKKYMYREATAAVRDLQEAHKLTVDGIIGPKTWEVLRRWL